MHPILARLERLAGYLALVDRPPAWDVVVVGLPEIPAEEYQEAGATWLVAGISPEGGWVDELRATIHNGPRN